jgi:hypothetical protein
MLENRALLHPLTARPTCRRPRGSLRLHKLEALIVIATLSTFACVLLFRAQFIKLLDHAHFAVSEYLFDKDSGYEHLCPQAETLVPSKNEGIWGELVKGEFATGAFKTKAIAWLSGAVQVKCVHPRCTHVSESLIGRQD